MEALEIKGKSFGGGRPLVCVPVAERTGDGVLGEIAAIAKTGADIIEWRIDAFGGYRDSGAVRELLRGVSPLVGEKVFLATFRTRAQGGEGEADPALLSVLYDLEAESGCVDLVDLEFFEDERPARTIRRLQAQGMRVVASHHDFDGTPNVSVMQMLLERMRAGNADIVKLAVMPQSVQDVLALLAVTADFTGRYPDTPAITMSMGKLGAISRVSGETFGSCVTFGAHGRASAPGQMPLESLIAVLDALHQG